MTAPASKSGSGPMLPLVPKAVCKFAAALGGVPLGAPVGAVVLLVAGAAWPSGLMGRVMVRPSRAPSYEASCPGSYTPPKKWIPTGGCTPTCARSAAASPNPFPPSGGSKTPNGSPASRPPAGP